MDKVIEWRYFWFRYVASGPPAVRCQFLKTCAVLPESVRGITLAEEHRLLTNNPSRWAAILDVLDKNK